MSNGLLIWEGIFYGFTLTILLGPIFVAITQTGIEKGLRAGLLVGLGIWTSDIIIIGLLILLTQGIDVTDFEGDFKKYFGLIGGLILIGFGIATTTKKAEFLDQKTSFTAKSISGYWLKGFLVNTINPFTFIFWTTLITSYVFVNDLDSYQTFTFFASIMITVMITDSLKVIGAKSIRQKLTKDHVNFISKIAGIALVIFGVVLIIKSWL